MVLQLELRSLFSLGPLGVKRRPLPALYHYECSASTLVLYIGFRIVFLT